MLARFVGFALSVAKWFLLAVGATVVVIVWGLMTSDGKAKQKANEAAQIERAAPVAEPAAPVVAQAAADGAGCACASGAVCTGPRGGQYCLDDGGKKRYK